MNGTPTVLGILLVDDNADWSRSVQQLIENALPHSNREVRWEASLKLAFTALTEFHADSIWLDLDLSDSRPQETIAAIPRLLAAAPGAPICVFSDHFDKKSPDRDAMVVACMKAGAHRCATKDAETVDCVITGLIFHLLRVLYHVQKVA